MADTSHAAAAATLIAHILGGTTPAAGTARAMAAMAGPSPRSFDRVLKTYRECLAAVRDADREVAG